MCEAIQGMIDDAVNDTFSILSELKSGTSEDKICAKLRVPMERVQTAKEFLRSLQST